MAEVRVVSDQKPRDSAIAEEATLEDLYLYYFQEKTEDKKGGGGTCWN
jgi:hypothetical protein